MNLISRPDQYELKRKRYNRLTWLTPLDRFVLYEGERFVHEFVMSAQN
jgi:hypothetical protein